MNTRTARSQLMGGMIWGIGQALHEATEIDSRYARYVNRDLQDYLVPVNADIKDLQVILVPEVDHAVNPAGVKGLGELGNVGTAAAVVANPPMRQICSVCISARPIVSKRQIAAPPATSQWPSVMAGMPSENADVAKGSSMAG